MRGASPRLLPVMAGDGGKGVISARSFIECFRTLDSAGCFMALCGPWAAQGAKGPDFLRLGPGSINVIHSASAVFAVEQAGRREIPPRFSSLSNARHGENSDAPIAPGGFGEDAPPATETMLEYALACP